MNTNASRDQNYLFHNTQIITRFYFAEAEYASTFFSYYLKLGIPLFIAIVQTEEDEILLKRIKNNNKFPIKIVRIQGLESPNECIERIELNKININQHKYSMLLDLDEFIGFKKNTDFAKVISVLNSQGSISFRWLMALALNQKTINSHGFWGHIGKQIALTEKIAKPVNVHFLIKPNSQEYIDHGVFIVHVWCRGINDAIAKTLFAKYKNAKTADQEFVEQIINRKKLPNRLRLLAYISLIPQSIEIPQDTRAYLSFDDKITQSLVMSKISKNNYERLLVTFNEYRNSIRADIIQYLNIRPYNGFDYTYHDLPKRLHYCKNIIPFYPNHNPTSPSLKRIIDCLP